MNIAHTLRAVHDVVCHARNSSELFKLIRPGEGEILNAGQALQPEGDEHTAQVIERLTMLRRRLESEAYITHEARVDYARLASSDAFTSLESTAQKLCHVALTDLCSIQERKAFLINLYNVLMIHAVIKLEIAKSVLEVPTIFSSVGYLVGEHVWTLDALEHGALRDNAPHPTTGRRALGARDARLDWRVPLDPRVHAALVCAANSCPPIRMYEAVRLDEQLDLASDAFVLGSTRVDHERRQVITSSIFAWYASDFARSGGVPAFLLRHSKGELHEALSAAFDAGYMLTHSSYDWTLNAL